MDTIIYRQSDQVIGGYVFPRRTPEQTQQAVVAEIDSITQSELGGIPNNWATVEVSQALFPNYQTVVNVDRSVDWILIPLTAGQLRLQELKQQLLDDTISLSGIRELMRLERFG